MTTPISPPARKNPQKRTRVPVRAWTVGGSCTGAIYAAGLHRVFSHPVPTAGRLFKLPVGRP